MSSNLPKKDFTFGHRSSKFQEKCEDRYPHVPESDILDYSDAEVDIIMNFLFKISIYFLDFVIDRIFILKGRRK